MLDRIFGNIASSAVSIGVRMVISIAMTPFVIHHLGRDLYGIWVLMLTFSVSGYLSLFSLGIQAALVKSVAAFEARGEHDEINQVFSAAVAAYSILGLIGSAVLLIFARTALTHVFRVPPAYADVARDLLTIIAFQALVDFPGMAIDGVLAGLQRYDVISGIEIMRSSVLAVATIIILRSGHGVLLMATTLVVLSVAVLVSEVALAKRFIPALRITRRIRGAALFDMIRVSGQMFVLRLNAVVYGQMDKAILGIFLTTSVLTDYDVAARFHALVLVAMGLISSVVMPTSSALDARGDHVSLQELFMRGTKFSAALSVPLSVMLMILAGPLLEHWIGPAYVRDTPLVWLFLSYTIFFVLVGVGWNMMIGIGRAGDILRVQLATTAVNLALSIVLTLRLGIAGVLWGTLIGNALAAIWYFRLYLHALQIRPFAFLRDVVLRVYPQTFAVGALFAVVVHLRRPESLVETAVYAVAFLIANAAAFIATGTDEIERRRLAVAARGWAASIRSRFV